MRRSFVRNGTRGRFQTRVFTEAFARGIYQRQMPLAVAARFLVVMVKFVVRQPGITFNLCSRLLHTLSILLQTAPHSGAASAPSRVRCWQP